MNLTTRLEAVQQFYTLLQRLEAHLGGKRRLANCTGRMGWPERGVYFFFEPGEIRNTSGQGPRVVRVGTHGLGAGSRSTLWQRLHQHQGTQAGGGNHRGSIFRLHAGTALIQRDAWPAEIAAAWDKGQSAPRNIREAEKPLEQAVSQHIRSMPFLWLEIADQPGPNSLRGVVERSAIALLSNYNDPTSPIDPPSSAWLGHWATRETVRRSGLWNVNHVSESPAEIFLELFERLVG